METEQELIRMAKAAERDDRLSSGPLYGKLATALELAILERDAAQEVSRAASALVEYYQSHGAPVVIPVRGIVR